MRQVIKENCSLTNEIPVVNVPLEEDWCETEDVTLGTWKEAWIIDLCSVSGVSLHRCHGGSRPASMCALHNHRSGKDLKGYLAEVHTGSGRMYPVVRVLWIKPLLPEQPIMSDWFSVVPRLLWQGLTHSRNLVNVCWMIHLRSFFFIFKSPKLPFLNLQLEPISIIINTQYIKTDSIFRMPRRSRRCTRVRGLYPPSE